MHVSFVFFSFRFDFKSTAISNSIKIFLIGPLLHLTKYSKKRKIFQLNLLYLSFLESMGHLIELNSLEFLEVTDKG